MLKTQMNTSCMSNVTFQKFNVSEHESVLLTDLPKACTLSRWQTQYLDKKQLFFPPSLIVSIPLGKMRVKQILIRMSQIHLIYQSKDEVLCHDSSSLKILSVVYDHNLTLLGKNKKESKKERKKLWLVAS